MATLSESDRLSDEESTDLFDRVERFRAAWEADGSGGMARFVPPHGVRHRSAVLAQVVVADMERRAAAGLPFRVDTYTTRFPKDFTRESPPVALLIAEYRLRHQFADKPDLSEYRDRFPARFDELTRGLQAPRESVLQPTQPSTVPPPPRPTVASFPDIADLASLPAPAAAPPDQSGVTRVSDRPLPGTDGPRKSTLHDSRPITAKSRGSKVGDLVVTRSGDLDATPVRSSVNGKSTILPNDAPYELLRKLGEGAFGEVFEALAPGGIRVAVKRISRNVDHPASMAEREALEVVKNLKHPFLLQTQAYWVFDDRLVIVMELADGSLADKVSQHQAKGRMGIPPEELIPLFEQSSKALDYLHSQNVSHRDIKPENILILKEHAKVGDFGLARPQEHAMTIVGQTVGTPAYMAPEMWQQKVSIHSDQYSLAATYVRCRLGRNLFETTVLIEMASFHIHETPNLGNLSEAEQAVLLKALAKNPDDRFPSCAEFAAALRQAVLSPGLLSGGSNFGQRQNGTAIREALQVAAPPRPSPLRAILPMVAVGLVCVVTMVIALIVLIPKLIPQPQVQPTAPTQPPPVVQQPPPTPSTPEKKYARVPGWEPADLTGALSIGDKHYPRKLTRQVGGETLEAILVYKGSESEPESPFYMLKNKVTNRVFAEAWANVVKNQKPALDVLETKIIPFPAGWWQQGVKLEGKALGVGGEQAGVPVVAVTLPEAVFAARELGGRLPTFVEWRLAAGSGDSRTGPAGPPLQVPSPELDVNNQDLTPEQKVEAVKFTRKALGDRNLALGLTRGPWSVERVTADVSKPWGIHQLVTNGSEWLGNLPNSTQLIDLDGQIPAGKKPALVIGHNANEFEIATFGKLEPGVQEWLETDKSTGFRIVLIPK